MITADQLVAILKARSLGLIPVRSQSSILWRVVTISGTRATGRNQSFASPEEAVEAAEIHLGIVESRESGELVSQAILALSRGDFFIRPEEIPDPSNPGEKQRVFNGFRANGQPSSTVRNRTSFIQSVLDMEKEVVNERSTGRNTT